jgi:toxin FitB
VIVLDASVLIAHFYAKDAHHERADQLLADVADNELLASQLTLAEVLVGPVKAGLVDQAQTALRRLGVRSVGLPEDGQLRLAELRAMTGLRLPDCCVLLAAEQQAAALATFDDRLGSVAAGRGVMVWGV